MNRNASLDKLKEGLNVVLRSDLVAIHRICACCFTDCHSPEGTDSKGVDDMHIRGGPA